MALNLHGVNIRANNMSSNFMYLAAGLMLLQGALFTFKPEIPITDSWGAKFANNQEMRVMHQALGGLWYAHLSYFFNHILIYFYVIIFAPLFNNTGDVFDLGVRGIAYHI